MASNFSKKCEEYFGTRDFYEILKIDRNSTDKEIKKAYHRLSLIVHPDRVDESKKLLATEKFKILGRIHSILQNSDKRKVYNECGEFDEESEISCSWQDYWKSIFKVITTEDIENFEKSYIGSETELQDLKRAYIYGKGDMDYIIQVVPFSNCASESRFIEIIRKLVDNGEVEEHDCFFNEPTRKRNRRIRKEEQDRKLFEEVGDSLIEEINRNRENRESEFVQFLTNLESKYCKPGKKRKSIQNSPSSASPKKRKSLRRK